MNKLTSSLLQLVSFSTLVLVLSGCLTGCMQSPTPYGLNLTQYPVQQQSPLPMAYQQIAAQPQMQQVPQQIQQQPQQPQMQAVQYQQPSPSPYQQMGNPPPQQPAGPTMQNVGYIPSVGSPSLPINSYTQGALPVTPKYLGNTDGCDIFSMNLDQGAVTMARCKGPNGPVFMQVSSATTQAGKIIFNESGAKFAPESDAILRKNLEDQIYNNVKKQIEAKLMNDFQENPEADPSRKPSTLASN